MKFLPILLLAALGAAPQEKPGTLTGRITLPAEVSVKKSRLKLRYAGQTGLGEKKEPAKSPAVVWLEGPPASRLEGQAREISQEGLEFRPRVMAVQTGTTVKFPNLDTLYHNVFSYSPAKRFDLGRYSTGESKEVTFEQKGRVDVFCEVHEHMRAFIIVVDHPWFALAAEDGSYSIPGIPPGRYTLVAWHESFEPVRQEVEVQASGSQADVKFSRRAEIPRPPTLRGECCGPVSSSSK